MNESESSSLTTASPISNIYATYINLSAGHAFHLQCVATWLNSNKQTCPICRADWEYGNSGDQHQPGGGGGNNNNNNAAAANAGGAAAAN